jgi:predicted lipid-binding transport protein (Tim44 family)
LNGLSWRPWPRSSSTSSTPPWVVGSGVSPRTRRRWFPANAPTRDLKAIEAPPEALSGIAALRARQPDFDIGQFLSGARQAYEMIVKAFAAGDRETLKPLLSPTSWPISRPPSRRARP